MKLTGFFLLGLLALSGAALAQQASSEPSLTASAALLQKQYAESFPGQPQLYSGPEYPDYYKRFHARIGHQFFQVADPQPGSVHYDGYHFRDLRLRYDVVRDQLVLPLPNSPLSLQLISERVHSFFIGPHKFIRLQPDSTAAGSMRPGYYQVLVDSTCQVLARRTKRVQQQVIDGNIDAKFLPADKLFIRKGGIYYPISKKSAALRLLADKSKEMQQFIQQQRLSFKKEQFEPSIVQLVRHYNRLTTP